MLFHVVAMANGRVIGKDNQLPWHFSSDLKHFKQLTTGSTVIMGRKTYDSILAMNGGKILPNRENFVLSHKRYPVEVEKLHFFNSIEEAMSNLQTDKAYIIGGQEIFSQTMNRVDGIYLTNINADYKGDAFYPELPSSFKEKSRTLLQENPKIEVIYYEK